MWLSIILPIVVALGVGGWIGSCITHWMTIRREMAARAVQFRKQQLEQFYGPLLAMHKEIRARSELRVKLQEAIDTQHMADMLHAGPGKTEEASDAAILANIRDEHETLRSVLMPRYHEMIDVFRDKMWLAEPETREYFKNLIEFVDVWAPRIKRPVARASERGAFNGFTRLELISKSPEEDDEAGELNKAQEILSVVLPADEDSALPLHPGEEALNEPAAHIAG